MPRRPWPLWTLTALLLIGFPAIGWFYYSDLLASGRLLHDGDSIMIGIMADAFGALAISPFALGIATLCLGRYNPRTRLTVWRRDRPLRSVAVTVVFGVAAVALAVSIISDVSRFQTFYGRIYAAYFTGWVFWLLVMRAAAIDKLGMAPPIQRC